MLGKSSKRRVAEILIRMAVTVAGVIFGINAAMTIAALLSEGDTFGWFLMLAPIGALLGAFAGLIVAFRVADSLGESSTSDVERHHRRKSLCRVFLGIPAAFVAIRWIGQEADGPPSDAAMLRHFEHHASSLDALIEMSSADKKLTRIDGDRTMPEDTESIGVSDERLATYRTLLRDAGTPRGFRRSNDQSGLDFFYWFEGSAISDDETRGFAYRTRPPSNIVPTLDGIRTPSREHQIAYRPIRQNWYLFYELIPD